jgi:5-methyltetrahydropteroyltriglutamate--homocysteine methyltransferase
MGLSTPQPRRAETLTTKPFTTSVIGSFSRPDWLLFAYDQHEQGKLTDREYRLLVQDALKLTIKEQELCGIDVITDGEQQRTSFVGFVGEHLPGFAQVHRDILHPGASDILKQRKTLLTRIRAVCIDKFGKSDLVVGDYKESKGYTSFPMKVTLPAPYLVMWETWHHEKSKNAYPAAEDLGYDFARYLAGQIDDLVKAGVSIVQIDEPMLGDLTEADDKPDRYHAALELIYGQKYRGFHDEVKLAIDMLNETLKHVGQTGDTRIEVHMDRWPNADSPHFNEGYERFLPELLEVKVDQWNLEYNSPGCGDPAVLARALADSTKSGLGVGCVSVTSERIESPEEIAKFVQPVAGILGPDKTGLVPNCGFAPGMGKKFPRHIAFAKLISMVQASKILRGDAIA